ncbi:hypothetical protein L208DRAFT_1160142, partial [Tricholoma matsutake]
KQKLLGFQAENGWKPQAWSAVADALKKEAVLKGGEKTATKCQDHWLGFGWDDGLKMVTASDEVWATYLKMNPKASRWCKTPFLLYDDIHFLVHGVIATGAGAFH